MVIQIRIDARLIHGQVVLGWTRELHTPGILVIDGPAATTDKMLASTLHMSVQAAGGGLKLLIKTPEDAVKLINDPRMDDYRVFGITRKVEDAWYVVKNCPGRVLAVNACAYGSWDLEDKDVVFDMGTGGYGSRVNAEGLEALKGLANTEGLDLFHQITPNYVKDDLRAIMKEKGVL